MATTTRKKLIIEKYTTLIDELEKYTDKSILPVLDGDNFDVVELIVYFNYFFMSCNHEDEYKSVILDIIDSNNIIIEPTAFDIVFPLILKFLIWFKNLL
jgi:hypothetical protein